MDIYRYKIITLTIVLGCNHLLKHTNICTYSSLCLHCPNQIKLKTLRKTSASVNPVSVQTGFSWCNRSRKLQLSWLLDTSISYSLSLVVKFRFQNCVAFKKWRCSKWTFCRNHKFAVTILLCSNRL